MELDAIEEQIRVEISHSVFIREITMWERTPHTLKVRLAITDECFVQIYVNPRKDWVSYTLVLRNARIYGRDNDGRGWHRHPYDDPTVHDFGPEGARPVTWREFLEEIQEILVKVGVL